MPHTTSFSFTLLCIVLAGATLFTAGCDSVDPAAEDVEGRPDGAVLIAERFNTPDGRVMYMGAFPQLPDEPVEISQLTELGTSGKAFACGGNAFFYDAEASTITKYAVEDDLRLTAAETIQLTQEGIEGWTPAHVCASETRAYTFHPAGSRVVEWNPQDMTVVEGFDIPRPELQAEVSVQYFEPYVAGELVYFPLGLVNWETNEIEPKTVVAVFDTRDESVTFAEDDRCLPAMSGAVDEQGNFYKLVGWQIGFALYSEQENLPPACILRINAGQKSIDPNFVAQYPENVVPGPTYPVEGGMALTLGVDRADAPATVGDFWDQYTDLPAAPLALDLATNETSPYPGIPSGLPENSRTLSLDGKHYFQIYSFNDDGVVERVEVTRLTRSGPEPAFTLLGGDVLTLERLW